MLLCQWVGGAQKVYFSWKIWYIGESHEWTFDGSLVIDLLVRVSAAENEASSLDILVCGNCQAVFHYIQEFQEHKIKNDCEKADKTSLNLQVLWHILCFKESID